MYIVTVFVCCILIIVAFTSFFNENQEPVAVITKISPPDEVKLDQPSILPKWTDGDYHDYYGTTKMLNGFNNQYPDLVKVFSIGKSVLGKDIWCIRLTNEKNDTRKSSCLIDGCIHGYEWEGGEACLYLAEYLLINFDGNSTITHILNSSEVNIIPLVNPDGRQDDSRYNENGIDLGRNFNVDFGRLRGTSIPLGKLFGRIKIPSIPSNYGEFTLLHKLFPSFPPFLYNCGRHPFSEPETQAMRDFMRDLANNDFSFYVNCHTAMHNVGVPWAVFKPPFEIPKQEQYIFDYVLNWVVENTEYEKETSNLGYRASGNSADWCYKEFRIPSFAFEILSLYYNSLPPKHDHLVHWMNTTLPVFMYFLVNIDNLHEWQTPDIQPSLPEGVPPPPLK